MTADVVATDGELVDLGVVTTVIKSLFLLKRIFIAEDRPCSLWSMPTTCTSVRRARLRASADWQARGRAVFQ